ncbi:MAG: hypothetical protein SFU86_19820 [Pirellulaceae bacterium]|nr:hypothetical protein [Pirellulaceae bacterium]
MRCAPLAGMLMVLPASLAWGQATTVQLPTYSFFTVQTAVSVPDRGGAYLGGISRARDGSAQRGLGPLANRGLGMDRLASGMSVHATIIDHAEHDRRLLAEAAARHAPRDSVTAKASELSAHVAAPPLVFAESAPVAAAPIESVAAIRARNSAAAQTRSAEAAEFFGQAQAAELAGKPAVARLYYQMVVRRDSGDLREAAQARLSALAGSQAAIAGK